ncbi:MAG: cysteine synthase A [Acholeplasmataceae bacterium]
MKIHANITELIGNTPLVRLKNIENSRNLSAKLIAKLENLNPMSSVKDRLAFALITSLEEKGLLDQASHIVEPTSGNTGIGLAMVSAQRGYRLTLVMPDTVSVERRQILQALGASVVLTPGDLGMQGAIDRARTMKENDPLVVIPMQFENPANPAMHRRTTAQEILIDTDRAVDAFVAGVGTGGTITGVGEILKKEIAGIRIVAVEPSASPLLSKGYAGKHEISGIGPGFIAPIINRDAIDEVIAVSEQEATAMARELARKEGIFAGISSGANLYAAIELAKRADFQDKAIVMIICDTGERYLSTPLYDADV